MRKPQPAEIARIYKGALTMAQTPAKARVCMYVCIYIYIYIYLIYITNFRATLEKAKGSNDLLCRGWLCLSEQRPHGLA